MNKIIKLSALLLCGLGVFASCDDDRDNNPTLQTPTTFQLNTPVFAGADVDMRATDSLTFSWSQPAYGFPVAASYEMQFSPENDWSVSVDQALADESGNTVPSYGAAGGVKSVVNASVGANDLATILERCERWKEDAVPATQKVYARCMAVYDGDTIYSNVQTFTVTPYYIELKNAAPLEWYLIGSAVGDGAWTNKANAIGTSIIPLYPITGQTYDAKTGTGVISITEYFPVGGQFKLVLTPGDWNVNIGYSGFTNIENNAAFTKNDDGNVVVNTAGYYTIKLDTKTQKATIEEYKGAAKNFAELYITGGFDSWGATTTPMTAFATYTGGENHDWVYDLTITEDGEVKFNADKDWKNNWGSTEWPYGTGLQGGSNIPAKAGSYKVFFNDITGQYNFLEK